jgi:hypothetical protein
MSRDGTEQEALRTKTGHSAVSATDISDRDSDLEEIDLFTEHALPTTAKIL